MAVSRERFNTEDAGGLLVEGDRQRILELKARTLVEDTRRKDERLAMNAKFTMRWRFAMIQRAASPRASPSTILYRSRA
jgi:hypothetical protein